VTHPDQGYVLHALVALMWLVAGGVETFATCHYRDAGASDARFNRRAAAAVLLKLLFYGLAITQSTAFQAFCYANGLVYLALLALVRLLVM